MSTPVQASPCPGPLSSWPLKLTQPHMGDWPISPGPGRALPVPPQPCAAFLPPDLQRGPTVALQMALKTPASVSL